MQQNHVHMWTILWIKRFDFNKAAAGWPRDVSKVAIVCDAAAAGGQEPDARHSGVRLVCIFGPVGSSGSSAVCRRWMAHSRGLSTARKPVHCRCPSSRSSCFVLMRFSATLSQSGGCVISLGGVRGIFFSNMSGRQETSHNLLREGCRCMGTSSHSIVRSSLFHWSNDVDCWN